MGKKYVFSSNKENNLPGSFTEIKVPSVLDTSNSDLIKEFFIPVLSRSLRYDRGVGYFSSGWLRVASSGMTAFASNGGRARWVTSPILHELDWEALLAGDFARADPILHKAIERDFNNISQSLEEDTLSALAWMVADEILDFKIALPYNKLDRGDFHDKFGIFTDVEGNQISFNGSYNDSIQGSRNYESIKIFCSWESAFAPLVEADAERFEHLWNNADPNVRVYDLPEAARENIIRLRKEPRPYPEPDWIKLRKMREENMIYTAPHPIIPTSITLRDYQVEAIQSWFDHSCQGLLEMATGTGKTITALAASVKLYERERQIAVIIAAPYQHLVDQWRDESKPFGYNPVLAYQSKARWIDELNHQILEFNRGYRGFISVITTHTSFITREFQESIARISGNVLLIADEAHHLGAERSRLNYPENISSRLALSATPDRWFDDVGTAALRSYFGETVYSLPLEKAIGLSLTNYYYYPHLVPLTDEELEKYEEFSLKIARLMNREDEEGNELLKMLLIRRAELLNKAERKLEVLSELVDAQEVIDHALFYCAPGQIDDVLRLLGIEKGLLVHRFTAEEGIKERQQLLSDFATGELQGLVAMKCLDEGVDVPSTRTAFFLASSSNPREFIQRRGRILRMYPGKEYSIIFDLIAVPPTFWSSTRESTTFEAERKIIRRELQRFKEFVNPALNKHQAMDVIWEIAGRYGLLDF